MNLYALRDGRITNCEKIIAAPALVDPLVGKFWQGPEDAPGQVTGTDLNDKLLGGHASDWIDGGAGDDVIWGDRLEDEAGFDATDILQGGAGNDTIYGGRGINHIDGGPGDDTLQGGAGTNNIAGGDGNDQIRLRGGSKKNTVDAGAGNDIVFAVVHSRARINCGDGYDIVYYARTKPVVRGCEKLVSRYAEYDKAKAAKAAKK